MNALTLEQAESWFDRLARRIAPHEDRSDDLTVTLATIEQRRRAVLAETGQIIRETDRLLVALTQTEPQSPARDALVERARAERAFLVDALVRFAPDEAWYWTEDWQAGEREVDKDVAAGHTRIHESTDEFLDALDAHRRANAHA